MPTCKIASPRVLQSELQRISAYCQTAQPSRKVIASELGKLARDVVAVGHTWIRRLNELQDQFMTEVMHEASKILEGEGFTHIKIQGNVVEALHEGGPEPGRSIVRPEHEAGDFRLILSWSGGTSMTGSVRYGPALKKLSIIVTSVDPMQVASESIYAHFHGVLP
jgi:hypothetical protein